MATWTLPSRLLIDDDPTHPDDTAGEADFTDDIRAALNRGKLEIQRIDRQRGPQATRYLLTPEPGANPLRIKREEETLSLATGTTVRYAGVVGRAVILEVPNVERSFLGLATMPLAKGKIVVGALMDSSPLMASIAVLPHMIVAGTTGSGKSEYVNAVLASILVSHSPQDLRLVLIDPKRVELAAYAGVPHLLRPIVMEASDAVDALRELVTLMDDRYATFEAEGVKTLAEYNSLVEYGDRADLERLPLVVCVIDELADLMAVSSSQVEASLVRLGQLARAAGIHMIVATQRPAADVLTKRMTANMPSRVAFRTQSHTESQIILGASGAERLLGKGDGLFLSPGQATVRFQSPRVTPIEVERLVRHWKREAAARSAAPVAAAPPRRDDSRAQARADALAELDSPIDWDFPPAAESDFLPDADLLLEESGITPDVIAALTAKVLEALSGQDLAQLIAENLAAIVNASEK